MTERNHLCPCGSGKKYKYCGHSPTEKWNCIYWLKKDANLNIDFINKHFAGICNEINIVFEKTKCNEQVPRAKMILVFALFDTIVASWAILIPDEILNLSINKDTKELTNTTKWKFFSEEYILKNNKIWDEYKFKSPGVENKIGADFFYDIRCSLVHFWGLKSSSIAITAFGMNSVIQKNNHKGLYTINPDIIYGIILESFTIVIQKSSTKNSEIQYFKNMKKLKDLIEKDGVDSMKLS